MLSLGTDFATNGKGVCADHALASAYGEFMERMQNLIVFKRYAYNPEKANRDFVCDPNEKKYPIENWPELPTDFENATFAFESQTYLQAYEKMKKKNIDCEFVPFYDVKKEAIQYLPYQLIYHSHTSNGMSAGNTPEEAISQGISEVLERYALKQLYFGKITPPTIPHDYIKKNAPEQYRIIKQLEETAKCKIIVKDCSLNKGIPSVATAIIFQDPCRFIPCVGTDPIWQLALERCLTEPCQGIDVLDFHKSTPLKLTAEQHEEITISNFKNIHTTDIGLFPTAFFDSKFSYEFNGFPEVKIDNYKEKLKCLINVVEQLNHNMYVRDVSFLGFPAYHVVVPGMSEVYPVNFSEMSSQNSFWQIDNLSVENLKLLARQMENFSWLSESKNILFSEFLPLATPSSSPYNDITLEFILTLIYYKLGEYSKAQDKLSDYIDYAKTLDKNMDCRYHYVAVQFLGLMERFPNDFDRIKEILYPMFDENVVDEVISDFFDKDTVFKYISLPDDWETLNDFSDYNRVENIFLKVKQKYKENPIDQMRLKEIFKQN